MIEVKNMKIENLIRTESGYSVSHIGAKQRNEITTRRFIIPHDEETPYAQRLDQYLAKLKEETNVITGELVRGTCGGKRFTKTPMGKSLLYIVGVDIARWLELPEPERFSGHTFRRSAATNAAANMATPSVMQKHFGWADPKTALR